MSPDWAKPQRWGLKQQPLKVLMNHSDLTRIATDKVRGYTLAQCEFAIADIHATLALHGDDLSNPYVTKLYAELDAARDRRMVLQSKTIRTRRAIASAHALIASL